MIKEFKPIAENFLKQIGIDPSSINCWLKWKISSYAMETQFLAKWPRDLHTFKQNLLAGSVGKEHADQLNPNAIQVREERGTDIEN